MESGEQAAKLQEPLAPPEIRGLALAREFGELITFSGRALAAMPRSLGYFAEISRQAAIMIPATTLLLVFMQFLIGVTAVNFAYFLLKALGAADFLGIGTALTARAAPQVMFGYVFVSKVCGGFVAELGSMKISQEVAALETNGVDPMRYLVATRMWAAVIFIPIATAMSFVGFFIGMYVSGVWVLQGISGAGMLQFFWGTQGLGDALYLLVNVASTALITGLAACFYGLRTSGGPADVGISVSRAVVVNLLLAFLLGLFWITTWFGTGSFFPIGG